MPRIKSENMNIVEVIKALAEGNIGAVTVLTDMYKKNAEIDPESFLGEFTGIMFLDEYEIYGSRIWMLYKDVCGQNLSHALGLIRATQLGLCNIEDLNTAIDNRGQGINKLSILEQLQKELPEFKLDK